MAHLVRADALVLLSDVDGLYDGDPRRPGLPPGLRGAHGGGPGGVVAGWYGASGLGSGGMASKVDAARVATSRRRPGPARIGGAGAGAPGRRGRHLFAATGSRRSARLLWLAHASTPSAGSARRRRGAAVVERGQSLLPAGITAVEGEFDAGDPVELCRRTAGSVARGLVAYDSGELPALLGRSTRDLGLKEVVHRDDLVLTAR